MIFFDILFEKNKFQKIKIFIRLKTSKEHERIKHQKINIYKFIE